jgi:iron complex transport system substrate-binding protein
MSGERIVSLLPAATEMVCALGLADRLVGISHECNYPDFVGTRPRVTRSALPTGLSQAEIDNFVTTQLRKGESLYEIDEALLRSLEPDLILTQDLCEVCGVSSKEADRACQTLPGSPSVLRFSPKCLPDIYENLRILAQATGRSGLAERVIGEMQSRATQVARRVTGLCRPRVFCMEWLDPPYCSGHWVPEMVEIAGGIDSLSRKGTDSVRISWADVTAWAPEIIVLMPCGFGMDEILPHTLHLPSVAGWSNLPAVRDSRIFIVDANAYFARPGPRVIEGIELLARLIHPELEWPVIDAASVRLRFKTCEGCGVSFPCRPSAGCWCASVHVSGAVLRELREIHADCLCPACLGAHARTGKPEKQLLSHD